MVHKSRIIPGLSKFVDEAILVHYPPTSMKRILAASGVSLFLKGNEGIVDSLVSNPMIVSLGVVTPDGMVDVDKLRSVLKSEIQKAGYMRISLPILGDIDFTAEDIDTLYRFITEMNTTQPTTSGIPATTIVNGGVY